MMLALGRRIFSVSVLAAATTLASRHSVYPDTQAVVRGRIQRAAPNGGWLPASSLIVTLRATVAGARSTPVYTGPDGMYYFNSVPSGRYDLEVWYPGARAPFVAVPVTVQYVATQTGPLCDIPPVNLPRG
jgi:hypothetical protein